MPKTPRSNDASHADSSRADEESEILICKEYFKKLLPLIKKATSSIDILMFHWGWYEDDIACEMQQINFAIVAAQKRGVKIRVYCNMLKTYKVLSSLNIPIKLYKGAGILHIKLILIDSTIAVMGSHNFSQNALCFNREISILLRDRKSLVRLYDYFNSLWRTNI